MRTARAILAFLTMIGPVAAAAEFLCVPGGAADRTSSPACALSWELRPGARLCLSRELWRRLARSDALPACAEWNGVWKAGVPRRNEPGADGALVLRFEAREIRGVASSRGRGWTLLERARENVSALFAPFDRLGILRKLLLGEKITDSPHGMLRLLGFVHLLNASGIHLYALAGILSWFGAWAGGRAGFASATAFRISRAVALSLSVALWALCGLRPGMLRPFALVLLRESALGLGLRWRAGAPLALALGLDLALAIYRHFQGQPAWAPGRWHYALAVGGGLAAAELCRGSGRRGHRVREHLALAGGSWIGVALGDAWAEGWVALATPLISLVCLPLFCAIVYPAALLAVLLSGLPGFREWAELLARGLGYATGEATLLIAGFAMRFETFWIVSRGSLAAGAAFAGAVIVLRGAKSWSLRGWTRALLLALFFRAAFEFRESSRARPVEPVAAYVEQLDVGQGDAALIAVEGGARAGMLDTGDTTALGEEAWVRLFSRRGISRLDFVALTHLDRDHAGGLERLSLLVEIGCVAASSKLPESRLSALGPRLRSWSACFPFQATPELEAAQGGGRVNGNAVMTGAFVPFAGGGGYLNLGDADRAQERDALQWWRTVRPDHPGPVILKVSHHGSRFSSDPGFLSRIGPSEAWISSGVGNRFGHPTLVTLTVLAKQGIPVRRTDLSGALHAGGGN